MAIARHVRLTGRVQGVFFRQSTVEKARELGVAGWVRNRPEGSVETHIEGEESAVLTMIDWLHDGPPDAEVEFVRITDAEVEDATGFEIRRG